LTKDRGKTERNEWGRDSLTEVTVRLVEAPVQGQKLRRIDQKKKRRGGKEKKRFVRRNGSRRYRKGQRRHRDFLRMPWLFIHGMGRTPGGHVVGRIFETSAVSQPAFIPTVQSLAERGGEGHGKGRVKGV